MSGSLAVGRPKQFSWSATLLTTVTLVLFGVLVFKLSETSPTVVHLFYVPVLTGAFFFGAVGGMVVGILAGLLAGPILPLLAIDAMPLPPVDSAILTVSFTGVGFAVGWMINRLQRRDRDLNTLVDDTIRAFVRAIHAMDGSTARHSEKVAEYAVRIARELRMAPEAIQRIRWAALLHDVGKLSVPKEILNKPGPLDPEEWAAIRRHPEESERIVAGIPHLRPLRLAVRHHHERIDGKGYPDGVKGSEISLEARIISVADAFDAMTSHRPYRRALSEEQAVEQLLRNSGSQFDPEVVGAFLKALDVAPSRGQHFSRPVRSM